MLQKRFLKIDLIMHQIMIFSPHNHKTPKYTKIFSWFYTIWHLMNTFLKEGKWEFIKWAEIFWLINRGLVVFWAESSTLEMLWWLVTVNSCSIGGMLAFMRRNCTMKFNIHFWKNNSIKLTMEIHFLEWK